MFTCNSIFYTTFALSALRLCKTAENVCKVFGESSVTIQTCRRRFIKSRSGNKNLRGRNRWGNLAKIDIEYIIIIIGRRLKNIKNSMKA